MIFRKWILLLALQILAAPHSVFGQAGKPIVGWRYIPIQSEFWSNTNKFLKEKSYSEIYDEALKFRNKAENDSEKNEADLAISKALLAQGYTQAAFENLVGILETAPGSFAANEALVELAGMVPLSVVDDERLMTVINRAAPLEMPEAAIPFVGYYMAVDHLQSGLLRWMKDYTGMIKPGSFWSMKLEYYRALELLKSDQVEPAIVALQALDADPALNETLRHSVRLQLARLQFERKDYPSAEKIYSELRSTNRNTGRVLYERAWNQYYLKDYALALGMLESLKAPFFAPSLDPEQYVLTALILRDLCHYPEVRKTTERFFSSYNDVIKQIKENKPFHEISALMSMALIKNPTRDLADVVDALQKERLRFNAEHKSKRFNFIRETYAKHEKEIKGRLQRRLQAPLRFEAGRLLEIADQMKLLEYVSGLDENRIQSIFEARGYKAEKVDKLKFDKLYWPLRSLATDDPAKTNKKEFWQDELVHLRVLISDRCEGTGG